MRLTHLLASLSLCLPILLSAVSIVLPSTLRLLSVASLGRLSRVSPSRSLTLASFSSSPSCRTSASLSECACSPVLHRPTSRSALSSFRTRICCHVGSRLDLLLPFCPPRSPPFPGVPAGLRARLVAFHLSSLRPRFLLHYCAPTAAASFPAWPCLRSRWFSSSWPVSAPRRASLRSDHIYTIWLPLSRSQRDAHVIVVRHPLSLLSIGSVCAFTPSGDVALRTLSCLAHSYNGSVRLIDCRSSLSPFCCLGPFFYSVLTLRTHRSFWSSSNTRPFAAALLGRPDFFLVVHAVVLTPLPLCLRPSVA